MKIDYTLVLGDTCDELIEGVEELLKLGWEPQGGIAFYRRMDDRLQYAQAMITRTPEAP